MNDKNLLLGSSSGRGACVVDSICPGPNLSWSSTFFSLAVLGGVGGDSIRLALERERVLGIISRSESLRGQKAVNLTGRKCVCVGEEVCYRSWLPP